MDFESFDFDELYMDMCKQPKKMEIRSRKRKREQKRRWNLSNKYDALKKAIELTSKNTLGKVPKYKLLELACARLRFQAAELEKHQKRQAFLSKRLSELHKLVSFDLDDPHDKHMDDPAVMNLEKTQKQLKQTFVLLKKSKEKLDKLEQLQAATSN